MLGSKRGHPVLITVQDVCEPLMTPLLYPDFSPLNITSFQIYFHFYACMVQRSVKGYVRRTGWVFVTHAMPV